ncbi:hypothetical protein B0F90DRAFT_1670027 [Multifurca ochricompacta]|uniref:Cysteine-rich transmembrane CYSTM domain-containing protein n=1 Tax=Multifurca ochricompacta TaxID=376703 RepID=A0AAD4M153_9AGAM|nr:hypothetical protein B0F90DRAFT_1670027 [Multifurca ochricompacta]
MEAHKPAQLTASQPQQSIQMNAMNPAAPVNSQQQQHVEHQHKARRLRGGGAARDCFIGLIECFICFECCKGCCECCADIICKVPFFLIQVYLTKLQLVQAALARFAVVEISVYVAKPPLAHVAPVE